MKEGRGSCLGRERQRGEGDEGQRMGACGYAVEARFMMLAEIEENELGNGG